MNRVTAPILGLCAALAVSGCATAVAVNSTTSEIYVLKGDKLKVCTVREDKLDCDKSYGVPR